MSADADLYQRNLKLFEDRFPEIHARILAMEEPLSRLVHDDKGPIDIDLGSGRFHKGDGRALEAAQAEAFLANPYRVHYNIPSGESDSLIARRTFLSILHSLKAHGHEDLAMLPVTRTGFLIVLGVGLGYHLPLLCERTDTPHVIVVEPVLEFLAHSLRVVDWDKLARDCDERKSTLRIVCAQTPERMTSMIYDIIQDLGTAYLDGSYIYIHYPLWSLKETRRRLITLMPLYTISRGYFEDERKMVWNTATNLHKREFRILEVKPRQRLDAPAFLIGAGPSFDEAADFIREWRDHVVVFSSGSALQACLRQDIIPDFHTEMENDPLQYDKVKYMVESRPDLFPEGRFKGITLIGSTTLNPRVAPFFDDVIFFFRDAVSSTTSLSRGHTELSGIAPTVANTSLAAAAYLGFGEVYMFGYDCGWRDKTSHHAKDTIYYTSETFKETFAKESESLMTVPGNFGGQVNTEVVFDWSRTMLEEVLRISGVTAYNCSDGALIQGAIPKVPEAIALADPLPDRKTFLSELVSGLAHYKPGTFFDGFDFTPLREDLATFERAITATVDRVIAEDMPFHEAHDLIQATVREHERHRVISGMVFFTTKAELKLAAILINRITDEEARQKVTTDFFRYLRDIHKEMLTEANSIVDEAEDMVQGGPDPSWTLGLPITQHCSY